MKVVSVIVGSRGCLENVELLEVESMLGYSNSIVDNIKKDLDEEDLGYVEEFLSVDCYKGFNVVGLNEEEDMYVLDFKEMYGVCRSIIKDWNKENDNGVLDSIARLDF